MGEPSGAAPGAVGSLSVAAGSGITRGPGFERARHETVRYHDELYAQADLGVPGTWLARPHPLVTWSLDLVRGRGSMVAYDLGAGVGRHTIPIARALGVGSRVVAVDLLDGAIRRLRTNAARAGVGPMVTTSRCDLEAFRPRAPAGLVVIFSALEHLAGGAVVAQVLSRMQAVTRPGGMHVLGVLCDRTEVCAGRERPALVELAWTSDQALAALDVQYEGWQVLRRELVPSTITETRDGQTHQLRSTLVQYVAERPQRLGAATSEVARS
ncbi:class I SAM-dependent methyltransferase [Actinotalea sp. K2]|uniref:class I SAM-dependent methyltransferase n=1 Tax=Actinotalea sp. K2 TaxID=2939438 RepID=UPI002016BA71|nr:class I SAM-dependent methyltransferase [Actinotalea sp. K2]MCL3861137.1 class I SAM-dependent methyltransferase [Actinotalea sp. K2]